MSTTIEKRTKLQLCWKVLLPILYIDVGQLQVLQCISSYSKEMVALDHFNHQIRCMKIPSKYPVSVGFSGFGMKGGCTDSKLSQSMNWKNCILWTSLAVGRNFGSVVKNNSTAATASSDKASSSWGHSMSESKFFLEINRLSLHQSRGQLTSI